MSVTFDNIGEAAEIERGALPEDTRLGSHATVREHLPRLLEVLHDESQPATFFVEAINCLVYPEALRQIREAGHEVGCHAFRHENWGQVPAADERALLHKCLDAYQSIGLDVVGFRPPGGRTTQATARLLHEFGLRYVSPAGGEPRVAAGDLAVLPFQWHAIDGAYYVPEFAHTRIPAGDTAVTPSDLVRTYAGLFDEVATAGTFMSIIFHPMWLDTAERRDALRAVIRMLQSDTRLWVARCADVAEWLLRRPSPAEQEGEGASHV